MKKRAKQYKAVFRARIDFEYSESNRNSLHPGGTYYLGRNCESEVFYSDIVDEAVQIINNDLKIELQKYTPFPIEEVAVQAEYEGSIEIIYSVVISFLKLVGGLKDLYDSIHMIKEISERHIKKRLCDKFGRYFNVNTYVVVPYYKDSWRLEEEKRIHEKADSDLVKRDAFFYYLLVANIVLMVILAVLVFYAVKTVYF